MPESTRSSERGAHTRDQILDAAESLFAKRGFAATSLDDVARVVGLTRPALLYHFGSKRRLYDGVIERLFGRWQAFVVSALEHAKSPPERLETFIRAWIAYCTEHVPVVRLYLREVASADPDVHPTILRTADVLLPVLLKILDDGADSGEFERVDPVRILTAFGGTTLFYFGIMPARGVDPEFDPRARQRLETHEADVLNNVRQLLGLDKPYPTPDTHRRKEPPA